MQEPIAPLDKQRSTATVSRLFLGNIFNETTEELLAKTKEAAGNKHYKLALEGYNALLIREPNNLEFILDRTIVYINFKKCNFNEAADDVERLFPLIETANALLKAKFHYTQACIYYKRKLYRPALLRCSLALELDHSNALFYMLRAEINTSLAMAELAIGDCRKVMNLEPKNIDAYRLLSSLLADKLEFKNALQVLVEAEEICSDQQKIQETRQMVLKQREEYDNIMRQQMDKERGFCCALS